MHEISLPPIRAYLRERFLYDGDPSKTDMLPCIIVSARSIPGSVMLFQVLLENGVLRDKLPIHALATKPDASEHPFHYLQLWDCFSANFTAVEIRFLSGLRVSVYCKDRVWRDGHYLFTFQWGEDLTHGLDLGYAIDPAEHKSGHFIEMCDGQFAIQPNNRLKFHEPSFCTKPFPEKPDYRVNTGWWSAETFSKWHTEDTNNFFYETQDPEEA
jgi:hypothetical protein